MYTITYKISSDSKLLATNPEFKQATFNNLPVDKNITKLNFFIDFLNFNAFDLCIK